MKSLNRCKAESQTCHCLRFLLLLKTLGAKPFVRLLSSATTISRGLRFDHVWCKAIRPPFLISNNHLQKPSSQPRLVQSHSSALPRSSCSPARVRVLTATLRIYTRSSPPGALPGSTRSSTASHSLNRKLPITAESPRVLQALPTLLR